MSYYVVPLIFLNSQFNIRIAKNNGHTRHSFDHIVRYLALPHKEEFLIDSSIKAFWICTAIMPPQCDKIHGVPVQNCQNLTSYTSSTKPEHFWHKCMLFMMSKRVCSHKCTNSVKLLFTLTIFEWNTLYRSYRNVPVIAKICWITKSPT